MTFTDFASRSKEAEAQRNALEAINTVAKMAEKCGYYEGALAHLQAAYRSRALDGDLVQAVHETLLIAGLEPGA